MEKLFLWLLSILALLYIGFCAFMYFAQNNMLFPAEPLPADYVFHLKGNFQEKTIRTADVNQLNGLLFKADSSKGLIFYLHGNGDNLSQWGELAQVYTDLHYDVFFLDYRGYGKSTGSMTNEAQLLSDVQTAYDSLKPLYPENAIVILGYSIGTGPAAYLASRNHPKLLIFQAPYMSIKDMARQTMPQVSAIIPSFIYRYPLKTWNYVAGVSAPIVIFHGNKDQVISINQSFQLRAFLKPGDKVIVLEGQGHNGITENRQYLDSLRSILR